MSTSDIANYTGTPRSTVLRKLREFEKRGVAKTELHKSRRLVWLLQVNDPDVLRHVAWMLPHFSKRGSELSNLDTDSVAAGAKDMEEG